MWDFSLKGDTDQISCSSSRIFRDSSCKALQYRKIMTTHLLGHISNMTADPWVFINVPESDADGVSTPGDDSSPSKDSSWKRSAESPQQGRNILARLQ